MVVAFKVTGEEHGEWTVLRVSGELDLMTSPTLRQRVHDAVAEGRHRVVIDLSDVFFCDSSGVGVLIGARRLLRSCQGRLRMVLPAHGAEDAGTGSGSGSHVNRVINALGVRRLFDVQPDLTSAVTQDVTGSDAERGVDRGVERGVDRGVERVGDGGAGRGAGRGARPGEPSRLSA